jgi:hypothetical protein
MRDRGRPVSLFASLGTNDYRRAYAEWDQRRGRQAAGRPDRGLDPPSVSGSAVGSGSMDSAGCRTGGSAIAPAVVGSRSRRSDANRHDSRAADRQALGVRRGSETTGIAGFNAAIQVRGECVLTSKLSLCARERRCSLCLQATARHARRVLPFAAAVRDSRRAAMLDRLTATPERSTLLDGYRAGVM